MPQAVLPSQLRRVGWQIANPPSSVRLRPAPLHGIARKSRAFGGCLLLRCVAPSPQQAAGRRPGTRAQVHAVGLGGLGPHSSGPLTEQVPERLARTDGTSEAILAQTKI